MTKGKKSANNQKLNKVSVQNCSRVCLTSGVHLYALIVKFVHKMTQNNIIFDKNSQLEYNYCHGQGRYFYDIL